MESVAGLVKAPYKRKTAGGLLSLASTFKFWCNFNLHILKFMVDHYFENKQQYLQCRAYKCLSLSSSGSSHHCSFYWETRAYILDLTLINWIFSSKLIITENVFQIASKLTSSITTLAGEHIFQVSAQYSQVLQQYLASIVTIRRLLATTGFFLILSEI